MLQNLTGQLKNRKHMAWRNGDDYMMIMTMMTTKVMIQ